MKLNLNSLPYIAILILLVIVLLQNQSCEKGEPTTKIDTVYVIKEVHDTIPGKPIYLKGETDTVWIAKDGYVPDSTYQGLLRQYIALGGKLFKINTFYTDFDLGEYGSVRVIDTLQENKIRGNTIITNLKIKETIIKETTTEPPKRQLYVGPTLTGNQLHPLSGVYLGGIYKDKKDRMYGLQVGYNGEMQYGVSRYWKIKLK